MNKPSDRLRNSTNPLVSIVTPSFNQAQFIEKTIRSVLLQDYVNLEYFVLDSMSKDGTEEILNKYSGSITKAIREKDDGQSDAINKGFELSRGEIMAYLNSDDCYSSPHTVSRVVELFQEHPDVDVIYGKREYIDEAGYFALNYPFREFNAPKLLEACYIPQECVFWRRSIYEKAGNKVDKNFNFAMDYDLWLRFLAAGAKFLAVDEYFGLFRWYPGQKSNDVWIKHGLPEIAKLQKQHLGKALPEDEMTAFYQEYWYGVNRLDKMRTFSQSVRVWNTFMANKKEMLKGLTRDAWVFMNQLEIPKRAKVGQTDGGQKSATVAALRNANADGNYANFKKDVLKFALFDPRYYVTQTSENSADLLKHYYTTGWKLGLNPHPLFDTNYYLNANKDFQAGGGNPLEHWLSSGANEGRDPHPLFNLKHYRECSGVKADAASLVNHYQANGWKDGLSPHPLFDNKFYTTSYENWVNDGYSDPLSHYIARGGRDLKEPNGIFDSKFFTRNNSDLKSNVCSLIQFVTQSSDGNCHPLFDADFYEQQLQTQLANKWEAVQHYVLHGFRSLDPHPLFSTKHYLKMSPDVAAAGLNPLAHYLAKGHEENRSPHPLFESAYVLPQIKSTKVATLNALVSFVSAQDFSLKPHPLFDPEFYCRQVDQSLATSSEALAHYWVHGWKLGLNPHPLINTLYYQRRLGLTSEDGIEPIGHYREFGHRDRISPHALFDYEHFSKHASMVPAAPTALEQFLLCDTLDVESHPLFSAKHYLSQIVIPWKGAADVLIDYCERGWKSGLDPYPLFDVSFYANFYTQTEPLAHYLEVGYREGLNPHVLFDSAFYTFQRPALKDGYMSPLVHYVLRGLNYKVSPHKMFDTVFYEQIEPQEVVDLAVPPLVRYLQHCYHPAIDPNPRFDTDYYCSLNPGLRDSDIDPLSHFLSQAEAPRATPFYDSKIDLQVRRTFLEACLDRVVWSFLDRGASLPVDNNAISSGITIVEVSPTDHKFRDGCEKVRGLQFRIQRSDSRHELCFNPQKQIAEIRELLAESGVSKIILHNFLGADREFKGFIDNLKSDYCVFIGDECSDNLQGADNLWERLSGIVSNVCLGSGSEFRPATQLNWQVSRRYLLDRSDAIYSDSPFWMDFFDSNFPALSVTRKSFSDVVNESLVREPSANRDHVVEVSTRRKITLGIPCLPGGGWTGGIHYLNSLLKAASSVKSDFELEIVLIAKRDSDWQTFAGLLKGWKSVFEVSDLYASSEIDALGLDCIFAAGGALGQCETPLISWLYDFQHMEMPQFFSLADIRERNRLFEKVVQDSAQIVLSSQHAQSICHKNFPQSVGRTRVLSFVPALSAESFQNDTSYIRAKYDLADCFFYLPNQFWLHKNHDVVVKALAELKLQGKEVMVVCTGATSDARDEKHFAELLRQVAVSQMRDSFLLLGMVPRSDVVALMLQCRAMIQPSLYEGWSTSVEEAKAFDVHIILSDIPVHREQSPAKSDYFPPLDFYRLAAILGEYSGSINEVRKPPVRQISDHTRAFEEFGHHFKDTIESMLYSSTRS